MAHEIYKGNIYSFEETPWHELGIVNEVQQGAVETLHMLGDVQVKMMPMTITLPDGTPLEVPDYKAIVRLPHKDDPHYRVFGTPATSKYELIEPLQMAEMFDRAVTAQGGYVETMGFLGDGERMFISVEMPSHDVGGDPDEVIHQYMLFYNPMIVKNAAGVYITGIRPVCRNTISAGMQASTMAYRIRHSAGAADLYERWMKEQYAKAKMTVEVLNNAYDVLAAHRANDPLIHWIADSVYPAPAEPNWEKPSTVSMDKRMARYHWEREHAAALRKCAVEQWQGSGIGLSGTSIEGTLYAAMQSVSQIETHRRGTGSKNYAEAIILGDRADRIRRAYSLSMHAVERLTGQDYSALYDDRLITDEEVALCPIG